MAGWFFACRTEEIPSGRGRTVEVEGLLIALLQSDDEVVALSDRCPHSGGSLGQGWIEADEVVCPLHQWRFKLKDGRCATIRGQGVHRFPVEIRGDEVWVRVSQ
jgi:nitrite reductase/ring-hydroxylating ferredoxin subunit